MKSLLTIFTFVFTLMFSSTSFAEWTKITESVSGNAYYVDFETVRKHNDYIYYWQLEDLIKPDINGNFSYINYIQSDCELFRVKILSSNQHKKGMGEGNSSTFNPKNPEWGYPSPKSVFYLILKIVCSR